MLLRYATGGNAIFRGFMVCPLVFFCLTAGLQAVSLEPDRVTRTELVVSEWFQILEEGKSVVMHFITVVHFVTYHETLSVSKHSQS